MLSAHAKGVKVVLWASLPCTAGSRFAPLNQAKGREQVDRSIVEWRRLRSTFCRLMKTLDYVRGDWAFEWPKQNYLWGVDVAQGLKDQHGREGFDAPVVGGRSELFDQRLEVLLPGVETALELRFRACLV